MSGIRKIHLIDMDTIDLTNLNRQFLFREKDINKNKAVVVAEFVMNRCPGVEVIPHVCRVQKLDYSFYKKFNVIIGGLDNIEARLFLNTMVHQINEDS
jgi:ubiquitin-activating enzyme E1 C